MTDRPRQRRTRRPASPDAPALAPTAVVAVPTVADPAPSSPDQTPIMNEPQTADAIAEAPEASEVVTVRAIEPKDREWYHAGKLMKKGDRAEVTRDQAVSLVDAGLVTIV